MKLARMRFNLCLCGRRCSDFVGLPTVGLPPFQAVERLGLSIPTTERDALEGTVPLYETTSRTQTLETSHTQLTPLIYYDARPFVALGSLRSMPMLEWSLICRNGLQGARRSSTRT
jgi:hypothetical protein